MAANDEFPRGLTLSSGVVNGTPTVTFPATPNISWVVDEIYATMTNTGSGNTSEYVGFINDITLGMLVTPVGSTDWAKDEFSWSGTREYPPNTAVTVGLSGPANPTIVTAHAIPV